MEEKKFCMKSRAELDEIRKQQASKKASVNEAETLEDKANKIGNDKKALLKRLKEGISVLKDEYKKEFKDYTFDFDKKTLTSKSNPELVLKWINNGRTSEGSVSLHNAKSESKINEISDEVVKRSEEKRYKDMETARAKEDKAFDKYANARAKWKKGTTAQGGANLDDISDYMNADIEWQKAREEDKEAIKKWSRNISLAGARDRRRQVQTESLTASKALAMSKSILDEISDELAGKVYQKRNVNQIQAKQKAMDMVMDKNASVSDVNKALDDSDIADEKKARNVDLYYSRIARKHYANKNESKINEEDVVWHEKTFDGTKEGIKLTPEQARQLENMMSKVYNIINVIESLDDNELGNLAGIQSQQGFDITGHDLIDFFKVELGLDIE